MTVCWIWLGKVASAEGYIIWCCDDAAQTSFMVAIPAAAAAAAWRPWMQALQHIMIIMIMS